MKSYSNLRRRAAIGRARHVARRPVGSGLQRADAAFLSLVAPSAGIATGDTRRATLHLRVGDAPDVADDPLRTDGAARGDLVSRTEILS